jgi:hypothetical protein
MSLTPAESERYQILWATGKWSNHEARAEARKQIKAEAEAREKANQQKPRPTAIKYQTLEPS